MDKCRTCVWADWRSGVKVYCPFPRCIKPEKPKSIKDNNENVIIDNDPRKQR